MAPKKKDPPKKGQKDQKNQKNKKDQKTKGALTERENFNSEKKPAKRSDSLGKGSKKTSPSAAKAIKVTKTSTSNKGTKKPKTSNGATRSNKKKDESIGTAMGRMRIQSQDVKMGGVEPEILGMEDEKDKEAEADHSKALVPLMPLENLSHEEPPRKKWKIDGPPITDPAKVPEGWDANEYDIDEFDINANIVRNIERIREGILPHFFEGRLIHYQNLKKDQTSLKTSTKGPSWNSLIRIDTLKRIAGSLLTNGDPQEQLSNIKGLIEAYENNELEWNPPHVTYWFAGKLYKGPEKFDKKAMSEYWKELGRPKSWWVEGWQGPGPSDSNFALAIRPRMDNLFMHMVSITVRPTDLDQATKDRGGFMTVSCLDDTGSENMLVYDSDIQEIERQSGMVCQDMGSALLNTVTGQIPVRAVLAEVCAVERGWNPYNMSRWCDVVIFVRPGHPLPGIPRLSGIWIRHIVYSQTRPDNQGILYLNDNGFEDTRGIPEYQAPRGPPTLRISGGAPGGGSGTYGGMSRIPPQPGLQWGGGGYNGGGPPGPGAGPGGNDQGLLPPTAAGNQFQPLPPLRPAGERQVARVPDPSPDPSQESGDGSNPLLLPYNTYPGGAYRPPGAPSSSSDSGSDGHNQPGGGRGGRPRVRLFRGLIRGVRRWFYLTEDELREASRREIIASELAAANPNPQPAQPEEEENPVPPGTPPTPEIPGSLLTAAFEAQFAQELANRPPPPPREYRQWITFNDARVPIEEVYEAIERGWNPDPPPPMRPQGYIPLINQRTGEINPYWIQETEIRHGVMGVFQRMNDWLGERLDASTWHR